MDAAAAAHGLAASATSAIGATRRPSLGGPVTPLEPHLDAEARSIAGQARKAGGREGIAAFPAKREPDFAGVADAAGSGR